MYSANAAYWETVRISHKPQYKIFDLVLTHQVHKYISDRREDTEFSS